MGLPEGGTGEGRNGKIAPRVRCSPPDPRHVPAPPQTSGLSAPGGSSASGYLGDPRERANLGPGGWEELVHCRRISPSFALVKGRSLVGGVDAFSRQAQGGDRPTCPAWLRTLENLLGTQGRAHNRVSASTLPTPPSSPCHPWPSPAHTLLPLGTGRWKPEQLVCPSAWLNRSSLCFHPILLTQRPPPSHDHLLGALHGGGPEVGRAGIPHFQELASSGREASGAVTVGVRACRGPSGTLPRGFA